MPSYPSSPIKKEVSKSVAPNFQPSGLLSQKNSLRFSLPADSCEAGGWRVFEFPETSESRTWKLEGKSAWLWAKDRSLSGTEEIGVIHADHPSMSRQHCVLVFRLKSNEPTPYILDLSTNGVYLNGERSLAGRMVELRNKDVLRFGKSKRDWVLVKDSD